VPCPPPPTPDQVAKAARAGFRVIQGGRAAAAAEAGAEAAAGTGVAGTIITVGGVTFIAVATGWIVYEAWQTNKALDELDESNARQARAWNLLQAMRRQEQAKKDELSPNAGQKRGTVVQPDEDLGEKLSEERRREEARAAGTELGEAGGEKKKKGSRRREMVGSTPSKDSPTGREVIDRMKKEGRIREAADGSLEVLGPDGAWTPTSKTDMSHRRDAVKYWNEEGYVHGQRAPEVREFMRDPENYELEESGANRSRGAKTKDRYRDPTPQPSAAPAAPPAPPMKKDQEQ